MELLGKLKLYTSAEIADSRVSIGFECVDREVIDPDQCYDALGKSGVKYARCQTGWARCEKQKGRYTFEWLDSMVDNLITRGLRPWFNVGYGNPIYMPDAPNTTAVGCVPLLYGDAVWAAWENYIQALATHFRGKVTCFEIWNEPNITQFWFPGQPSGRQYAVLVEKTGRIIRKIIPDARIGGSISSFEFSYLEEFAQTISPAYIDFYCFHAYGKYPEYNYAANVRQVERLFAANGLKNVDLWQGESGYPSWFPQNHWLHPRGEGSERQQAVWQLRRFFLDAATTTKMTSFFQIADMWERPYEKAIEVLAKPAAHGILNGITYTPKKSYETISRLATVLSGNVTPLDGYCAGRLEGDICQALSLQLIALEKNEMPMYIYYLPTDIEDEQPIRNGFTLQISDFGLKNPIQEPVLIDMYTGDVLAAGSMQSEQGRRWLADLPIAEYPMLLCDRSLFELR
jgi:polysaccharide biosynthesis protein PslG